MFSGVIDQRSVIMANGYMCWVIFTYLLCCQYLVCCNEYSCGTENACLCKLSEDQTRTIMNCSNIMLPLSDICKGTGNATYLSANSNKITTIEDKNVLKGCEHLLHLRLSNNSMTTFVADAFSDIDNLTVLDLSANDLDIYENDRHALFTGLLKLQTLLLNQNLHRSDENITANIYPDISSLASLQTLSIDGLANTSFPVSYANITTLINVSLSKAGYSHGCSLGQLSKYTFQNLKMIKTLNISACDIRNIEEDTFQDLHRLEILDLSQNLRLGFRMLRNVSYGLQFTSIKFLNYSYVHTTFGLGTEVRKRDICYLRNTTLKEVAMSSNRIQLFETNSIQLFPPTMQIFHINDNKFTFSPYLLQIACAANITYCSANFQNKAHNPLLYANEPLALEEDTDEQSIDTCPYMTDDVLKNISKSYKNCPFIESKNYSFHLAVPKGLTRLLFNYGDLQYDVAVVLVRPFDNEIEHLEISGNLFTTLIGPIGPFIRLKYLDISRNYCSYIGNRFFSLMTNIENLQLQQNFIGFIKPDEYKDIFKSLTELKTLNLSVNRITSIPADSFTTLRNLETLDLSSNSLEEWSIDVANLVSLREINIRFNFIQSLPETLLNHLAKISKLKESAFSIDMRNNSIKCSCQYKTFLYLMLQYEIHFVEFDSNIFVDKNGNRISTAAAKAFIKDISKNCRSFTLIIVLCSIGVSVFLSVVIGGVIYKNRWKLRYFFYMSKNRYFGYTVIPDEEPIENYRQYAFISYAEEDIRFIMNGIIPNLENNGITLCVHQRDLLPGHAIADNIIDAIKSSKKTVVILTKAFLNKKWCMYEFNMARMESMYSRDGRGSLLIVMMECIPSKDLPMEMLEWIKTDSYIEYTPDDNEGEALFWGTLKDAIKQG